MPGSTSTPNHHADRGPILRLLTAAAVGALLYFVLQAISRFLPSTGVLHTGPVVPKGHPVFAMMFRMQGLLSSPFMQPIYLTWFVVLTIVRRAEPNAWITAAPRGVYITVRHLSFSVWACLSPIHVSCTQAVKIDVHQLSGSI